MANTAMKMWNEQQFKIQLREGSEMKVTGLVHASGNFGLHTDPRSGSLHLTVLSGPHTGLRYGPPFTNLEDLLDFLHTNEMENEDGLEQSAD